MPRQAGTQTAFRDLIAEVIFDHFGDGGDMAIYCSKQTGEMIADIILEQAQARGLEPYLQVSAPCCQRQPSLSSTLENRGRDIPDTHLA